MRDGTINDLILLFSNCISINADLRAEILVEAESILGDVSLCWEFPQRDATSRIDARIICFMRILQLKKGN